MCVVYCSCGCESPRVCARYVSVLGADGPVIKHCASGKIMKVIKRQIIGFFRFVKWITSNSPVEKWLLKGRGVSRRDGEEKS